MNKRLDKYNFIVYNIIIALITFVRLHLYEPNHKHYTEVDIYKRRKRYV